MDSLLHNALIKLTSYSEADVQPITVGQSGSLVFRLVRSNGESAILKITEPSLMPDYLTTGYPQVAMAEYYFYAHLAPKLGLPCPKLLDHGRLDDSAIYLLLEDLGASYFIPNEGHIWSTAEMMAIAAAYGVMHGRTQKEFARVGVPPWLNPDPRSTYNPEVALACVKVLAENQWTDAVKPINNSPILATLLYDLSSKLNHVPAVLLYNDFYPPNVALVQEGSAALLIDFQLIGSGPCHVDIANIGFLSQDKAFVHVDSEAVLAHYLHSLAAAGGEKITPEMFWRDYRYAELLAWAEFLPRFVRAMHRTNTTGEHWGQWMDETFAKCMLVFSRELC